MNRIIEIELLESQFSETNQYRIVFQDKYETEYSVLTKTPSFEKEIFHLPFILGNEGKFDLKVAVFVLKEGLDNAVYVTNIHFVLEGNGFIINTGSNINVDNNCISITVNHQDGSDFDGKILLNYRMRKEILFDVLRNLEETACFSITGAYLDSKNDSHSEELQFDFKILLKNGENQLIGKTKLSNKSLSTSISFARSKMNLNTQLEMMLLDQTNRCYLMKIVDGSMLFIIKSETNQSIAITIQLIVGENHLTGVIHSSEMREALHNESPRRKFSTSPRKSLTSQSAATSRMSPVPPGTVETNHINLNKILFIEDISMNAPHAATTFSQILESIQHVSALSNPDEIKQFETTMEQLEHQSITSPLDSFQLNADTSSKDSFHLPTSGVYVLCHPRIPGAALSETDKKKSKKKYLHTINLGLLDVAPSAIKSSIKFRVYLFDFDMDLTHPRRAEEPHSKLSEDVTLKDHDLETAKPVPQSHPVPQLTIPHESYSNEHPQDSFDHHLGNHVLFTGVMEETSREIFNDSGLISCILEGKLVHSLGSHLIHASAPSVDPSTVHTLMGTLNTIMTNSNPTHHRASASGPTHTAEKVAVRVYLSLTPSLNHEKEIRSARSTDESNKLLQPKASDIDHLHDMKSNASSTNSLLTDISSPLHSKIEKEINDYHTGMANSEKESKVGKEEGKEDGKVGADAVKAGTEEGKGEGEGNNEVVKIGGKEIEEKDEKVVEEVEKDQGTSVNEEKKSEEIISKVIDYDELQGSSVLNTPVRPDYNGYLTEKKIMASTDTTSLLASSLNLIKESENETDELESKAKRVKDVPAIPSNEDGNNQKKPSPPVEDPVALMNKTNDQLKEKESLIETLMNDLRIRNEAIAVCGKDIKELRQEKAERDNAIRELQNKLKQTEKDEVEATKLTADVIQFPSERLSEMNQPSLIKIINKIREQWSRSEKDKMELEETLRDVHGTVKQFIELKSNYKELQDAHLIQTKKYQKLQEKLNKMEAYKTTIQTQEKLISKLQSMMENKLLTKPDGMMSSSLGMGGEKSGEKPGGTSKVKPSANDVEKMEKKSELIHKQQQEQEAELKTLHKTVEEKTKELDEAQSTIEELSRKVQEYEDQLKAKEESEQAVNQEMKEKEEQDEKTKAKQVNHHDEEESDELDENGLPKTLPSAIRIIDQLEAELMSKGYRIAALEEQLDTSAREASREIANLRTKLFELEISSGIDLNDGEMLNFDDDMEDGNDVPSDLGDPLPLVRTSHTARQKRTMSAMSDVSIYKEDFIDPDQKDGDGDGDGVDGGVVSKNSSVPTIDSVVTNSGKNSLVNPSHERKLTTVAHEVEEEDELMKLTKKLDGNGLLSNGSSEVPSGSALVAVHALRQKASDEATTAAIAPIMSYQSIIKTVDLIESHSMKKCGVISITFQTKPLENSVKKYFIKNVTINDVTRTNKSKTRGVPYIELHYLINDKKVWEHKSKVVPDPDVMGLNWNYQDEDENVGISVNQDDKNHCDIKIYLMMTDIEYDGGVEIGFATIDGHTL